MNVDIAIIGGSGLYELLSDPEQREIETPYGRPSDVISMGSLEGREVAFVPRHGRNHTIPPHSINHRANIHALASITQYVIGTAAVGVINTEINQVIL